VSAYIVASIMWATSATAAFAAGALYGQWLERREARRLRDMRRRAERAREEWPRLEARMQLGLHLGRN
jgi:hypothetical protein